MRTDSQIPPYCSQLHLFPLLCLSLSFSKTMRLDLKISPALLNKLGKEDLSENIQYVVAQLI